LWYRLGEAYERTNSPEDAVKGYARGAAGDPTAPWTEGRHRIAMIYQRAEQWQPLADLLAPLLGIASDEDLGRPIQPRQLGGAVWQETFLALGNAYDHLGKAAEAEATYERIGRIAAPRRDWTLNRALVYLARAKRARGDLASALEAVSRALDLSTEFDASYRREYELDTAAEADRVIDQARREGQLFTLQASVDDLVRRAPESPASWYLRGVASEAACDLVRARAAYERATSLIRPGAGAFLAARPVDPAKGPCPPR
jgi:tetratricopeptide (TPR) repeat protein